MIRWSIQAFCVFKFAKYFQFDEVTSLHLNVLNVFKVQQINCGIVNCSIDIYIRHRKRNFPIVIVSINSVVGHGVMVTDVMRQQHDFIQSTMRYLH